MFFCQISDLVARFGEQEIIRLTDKTHRNEINEANVIMAISDASYLIHSYLASVDVDKLKTESRERLKTICCDISRYYLYENALTKVVEKRYESALEWLGLVAKNQNMLSFEEGLNEEEIKKNNCIVYANPRPSIFDPQDVPW